jgi:hypothetical protein
MEIDSEKKRKIIEPLREREREREVTERESLLSLALVLSLSTSLSDCPSISFDLV